MPQSKREYPFEELARNLDGELNSELLRRYLLATDGSIFLKMPAAVIYPRSTEDVYQTIRFAAAHGLSVHPRGAGSGLTGAALGTGLIIDFSKYMNRLLTLDTVGGWFECEPGFRLGELEAALRDSGWFFPPDPSSGEYATFGGMCATNASGAHSVKYGNVADYLLDAEMVFADALVCRLSGIAALPLSRLPAGLRGLADLYHQHRSSIASAYPAVKCNVAGYNLRTLVQDDRLHLHRLICGSEGTLVVTTRLRFKLLPRPAADSLVIAFFDNIASAARAVQLALPAGPSGIEVMDKSLLRLARESDPLLRERIPADVDNVLLIEFDGATAEACAAQADAIQRQLVEAGLGRQHYQAVTESEKQKFWALRKAAVPILYKLKGRRKILALVEDAAVPVTGLVPFFEGLYTIFRRHQVDFVLYGHIAKGLLHTRPLLDLKDPHDLALLRVLADEVFELVSSVDGTVSGEHGDGRLRSAYVQRRYPAIYDCFQKTKELLDPARRLNPEIITHHDPDQMTRDLRFGAAYRAGPPVGLNLNWPEGFGDETEKCHGCSKCTTITTDTRMCPVYKFTRDEAAAPKAKANALRALISGAVPNPVLYAEAFREVMAYCVNCGSCFKECPSNVNIPKLAMEAKAIYLRCHGLRLTERVCAEVEMAGRLLRPAAPLLTTLARKPALVRMTARLTGLAPQRPLVTFASRSLFQRLPRKLPGTRQAVLFYAGCYAAYIRPELGEAAARVLNHLGMTVLLPPQQCCGLPMLSKGLADRARRKAQANWHAWQSLLPSVAAIVVTCSSCGYALKQDWAYLLPGPDAAMVQSKTIHISQLLNTQRELLEPHSQPLKLAYHQPCHLRLQTEADSSIVLLKSLPGIGFQDLNSHCCGMAGSWGLLAENFTLSQAIGTPMIERLNHAGADYGVTDCPTCQMQMEQLGNRPIRHPVEILWEGLHTERIDRTSSARP
jgi:FAD/FMN-containing dehydrogenase/Fe-S oxidoreductase